MKYFLKNFENKTWTIIAIGIYNAKMNTNNTNNMIRKKKKSDHAWENVEDVNGMLQAVTSQESLYQNERLKRKRTLEKAINFNDMLCEGWSYRNLGNIFIHIHPIGTISMASQELYDKEYDIQKSGVCYFGTPNEDIKNYANLQFKNSFLSFPPIIIDKPGKYFMWIQGKSNSEIITEKFELIVIDE